MLQAAQPVIILEKDEHLEAAIQRYLDRKNLSITPELDHAVTLANIHPDPVVIVGDPHFQDQLTEGVNFYNNPSEAVQRLRKTICNKYGDNAAVLITTAILPESWEEFSNGDDIGLGQIGGIPVIEKGSNLIKFMDAMLNEILQVRTGFARRFAHDVAGLLPAVGLALLDIDEALVAGNRDLALKQLLELAQLSQAVLDKLDLFETSSNSAGYLFRQGHFGGVFPLTEELSIGKEDRILKPEFVENTLGASHMVLQLKQQLQQVCDQVQIADCTNLSTQALREKLEQISLGFERFEEIVKGLYRTWTRNKMW